MRSDFSLNTIMFMVIAGTVYCSNSQTTSLRVQCSHIHYITLHYITFVLCFILAFLFVILEHQESGPGGRRGPNATPERLVKDLGSLRPECQDLAG